MKTTEGINSCLMLAVRLDLPVFLGCIFDSEDVTELELDSHVTILYAKNKTIDPKELMGSINMLLDNGQIQALTNGDKEFDLNEIAELDLFENDEDYLVLRLKDTWQKDYCSLLNKGLSTKFDVASDFSSYNPHITLATLKKGTGKKYLNSDKVNMVLNDGIIAFEDLLVSYGGEEEKHDKKQKFLTHNFAVPRYFRIENLKREQSEL